MIEEERDAGPLPVTVDQVAPLQEVSLRLVRRLRRRSGAELTLPQMAALSTLERAGAMPVGELSRREQISKSSMTQLISHLEDMGHVNREVNPEDARSALVSISNNGRSLLGKVRRRANEFLAHDVSRLHPADRDALLAALPSLEHLIALRRDDASIAPD